MCLADKLRVLRNQGMRARYQYETAGHNYRLTDLQAALACRSSRPSNTPRPPGGPMRPGLIDGLRDVPGLRVPEEAEVADTYGTSSQSS